MDCVCIAGRLYHSPGCNRRHQAFVADYLDRARVNPQGQGACPRRAATAKIATERRRTTRRLIDAMLGITPEMARAVNPRDLALVRAANRMPHEEREAEEARYLAARRAAVEPVGRMTVVRVDPLTLKEYTATCKSVWDKRKRGGEKPKRRTVILID